MEERPSCSARHQPLHLSPQHLGLQRRCISSRFLFLERNDTSGQLCSLLWGGCQPVGAARDTAGMWGCCPRVLHLASVAENLGLALLLLFSCTPAPSRVCGANVWYHLVLLHCNFPLTSIWWLFCSSSASNGTEHLTACAASGCAPRASSLLGPQPCGSGWGPVAVPSSAVHAFLPGLCKCLVTVGGHLARGDRLSLVQTLATCNRSTFCRSN